MIDRNINQVTSNSTDEEQRLAVRDLMADTIDEYMGEGGEFRAYDLADRLQKTFFERGWWIKWGAQIAHILDRLDTKSNEVDVLERVIRTVHNGSYETSDWSEDPEAADAFARITSPKSSEAL